MHRLLAVLLTALCAGLAATPASAYDAADLQRTLAREMRLAGQSSGAYVRDLGSGRELFALRATATRLPASVEKLYTTATTLLRLGPEATLDTRAVSDAALDPDGVLRGDLVLVGAGDPFFGTESAGRLAATLKSFGIKRIDGAVIGDESSFDRLRSACCSGYDPDLGGVLSALAYNRGFLGAALRLDAARFAATRFAEQLRAAGIRSSDKPRVGTAPQGGVVLAIEPSMPVRELIRFVNVPSNNFAAEMLLKALGERYGTGGSTRGGADVARATLREIDVRPLIADGSGLSRRNRTTPRDVVALLDRMDSPDIAGTFRASLAITGETGTVTSRTRGTPAFRRCRVKTGTLRDVSALAGYCHTRGGGDVAFALLMNRVRNFDRVRAVQDHIAAALARLDDVVAAEPLPSGGAGAP